MEAWNGFKGETWKSGIDVRDFIIENMTVYEGDESFLTPPTEATNKLWEHVMELSRQERDAGGVLAMDTAVVSTITSHGPGYLDQKLEQIVGLQTDEPFKRPLHTFGGIRMAELAARSYGYELDPQVSDIFTQYRKTHNQGVFDVYTPEMLTARRSGIITGLPDAYGRGRIIGDYRRIALYGIDRLLEEKFKDLHALPWLMTEENMRLREEVSEQCRALAEIREMAQSYGFDISGPAVNAKEAIQWLYFGYLAAVKEQNGAAMSLGRTSTFLDVYIERDLRRGTLTEQQAQELVDHFVLKLRLVRFSRTPDYNELFSGDPTWVTESLGGVAVDGRPLVTKNTFRMLHTLVNLGPAPEPNLTVLWSAKLPANFKKYCAKMSIKTSALQYENDDIMRPLYGDDYGIACCVSPMKIGSQVQFFGARANLAKALLYALNNGRDENLKIQVGPPLRSFSEGVLDFDEVMALYDQMLDWLANLYVNTLNVIHYMHDKYSYERSEMALHDTHAERFSATGIAGLSVVADSLSAIKYAKVTPVRDEDGIAVDFEIEGAYPKFGNNDDRVDSLAIDIVSRFIEKIRKNVPYRAKIQTQSVLTITSNVVYGKKTGATPDGRKRGEAFAPGANPMHGRDTTGAIACLCSVSKLPFEAAQDGISNTFSLIPKALGRTEADRVSNLSAVLDAYMMKKGHHLNINVFNRETLQEAMDHPERHPQLTIRVSGYAVNFIKLTREQQLEVMDRTLHASM